MKKTTKAIDNLFFAYHGMVGVLVGVLLVICSNFIFQEVPFIKETLNEIGSMLIVGAIFGLIYTRISRDIFYDDLKYLVKREETGFKTIYNHSNSLELAENIKQMILNSAEIKMYGIAINILWNQDILEEIVNRVKRKKLTFKIILANIGSEQIQTRLSEEEDCEFPNTHGKDVIKKLVDYLKKVEVEVNDKNYMEVKTFNHYPTYCLMILDENFIFYPYGYKTLGNESPTLHLSGKTKHTLFYQKQFEKIWKTYP